MAEVILDKISKSFSNKVILQDISLEVKDGEFLVLVGASGCGKSTLLRMIAGLEKQSAGNIFIGEKLMNNIAPKNRDIAMVFQNYALYPHLNVRENIALGLKVRKVAKCEIERRVERAAEILRLEEFLDRKPKQLSGGQRQRVALARAIVREPRVFLMDEPLSNLDAKLRSEMRSEIKKLHNRLKTTFIYVTHDQTEALTMGDRIVVLNEGNIEQIDTPENIYKNPANVFVATFMGSNPMNIIEADIKEQTINFSHVTANANSVSINLQDKKRVLLGVRPEDILTSGHPNYHFNLIKFSAKIIFEENLGSYKNVYFKLGSKECCAVVDSKIETKPQGEMCEFSINPRDIRLFDYKTQLPIPKD